MNRLSNWVDTARENLLTGSGGHVCGTVNGGLCRPDGE